MKYRIKERKNIITGEIKYAVEQQIYEGDKGWMLAQYTDEAEKRKFAIFDSNFDAMLFVKKSGSVIGEKTIWEGEA